MDIRKTAAIQPHPKNDEIYGDHADADLVESIRTKGVLNPLLITTDGRIISGHRRWDAAKRAGLAEVPVVLFGSSDELDILEALIESNRQREKNGEIIGREAKALLEVEAERARRRQERAGEQFGRGLTGKLVEHVPPAIEPRTDSERRALAERAIELQRHQHTQVAGETLAERLVDTGKARDVVGAKLGYSGRHVEKAAAVVDAIDDLKAAGKEREAEQLRASLNKSVSKGYEKAKEAGYIAPAQSAPKPPPALIEQEAKQLLTLPTWKALTPDQQWQAIHRPRSTSAKFNSQPTNNIEWALWSWNPVTGCKHDCSYCYARDIAARYYEWGFVPAFHPERLSAPRNTPLPPEAAHDTAYKNVFTCSMADLFGKWVPREWIDAVLGEVRANPQWNFLFLTKFPIRLAEFEFPDNAWVGTTVDAQARVANAEKAFANVKAAVKWLSCEPMLEPLSFKRLDLFQWVVIGGASRSTQTPEFKPPREWVEHLERQARDAGCKVYEKTNLLERLREYPGQPEDELVSVPDAFKMPYLQRDVQKPKEYEAEVAA